MFRPKPGLSNPAFKYDCHGHSLVPLAHTGPSIGLSRSPAELGPPLGFEVPPK